MKAKLFCQIYVGARHSNLVGGNLADPFLAQIVFLFGNELSDAFAHNSMLEGDDAVGPKNM